MAVNEKQIIITSIIAVVVLSSCAQTPENIEGANHNIDLKSTNKVSVEHILDDFDEALKQNIQNLNCLISHQLS